MASFTVPCPKTCALCPALCLAPKQQQCNVAFKPASIAGSSLRFQGSRHKQSGAFKVSARLNEVATTESSNCAPVPETKTEESAAQNIVPDASSITAFMTQVQDIVELVDSRDIVELHLKQQGCELIIRKKEALQQQAAPATVVMQSPAPQAMWPYQMPPAPVSAPAAPVSAAPATSPPASAPALPSPAKPKSSHPPMKCPMAGTLYRSPAPGAPPFVKEGDVVQKGQVLCIVEAMKLMNEIESDRSGTIVEVLASDGKPVSVDTPLFVIAP